MSDRVLYFPYINLPNNQWTIQSLLYWDEIGTIVPQSYIEKPEELSDSMNRLIRAGLVKQVFPSNEDYDMNSFNDTFLDLLTLSNYGFRKRRNDFNNGAFELVHVEKFNRKLFKRLETYKLAKRKDSDWYYVETDTSNALLLYLATVLSISNDYQPSTDNIKFLNKDLYHLLPNVSANFSIRHELLQGILPSPKDVVPETIANFKSKYQEELKYFRKKIEVLVTTLSSINEEERRDKRIIEHRSELKERKEYLIAKMNESNFKRIVNASYISWIVSGSIAATLGVFEPLLGGILSSTLASIKEFSRNPIRGDEISYTVLATKAF